MKSTVGIVAVICMVAVLAKASYIPPQCSPEVLEEIENKDIRKLCEFLTSYTAAVEQMNQQRLAGEFYPGPLNSGKKRQDVDHVFLRFGRRR